MIKNKTKRICCFLSGQNNDIYIHLNGEKNILRFELKTWSRNEFHSHLKAPLYHRKWFSRLILYILTSSGRT